MPVEPRVSDSRPEHGALTIAFLYPRWEAHSRSKSLDVLGYGLATEIDKQDQAIMLASGPGHDPDAPIRFLFGSARQRLFKAAFKVNAVASRLGLSRPVSLLTTPFDSFRSYGEAAGRVVHEINADIAHIFVYDTLVPLIAKNAANTKIVLHIHDHAQRRDDRDRVARHLADCDIIAACSEYLANATRSHFPELAGKITAVPNSIPNMPKIHPSPESKNIVFVGRISPEKGVHVLINAFRSIALEHPEATLTLVGPNSVPGPKVFETHYGDPVFEEALGLIEGRAAAYAVYLESLLTPELRNRVQFVGEVPNTQVSEFIRRSSVLALPSIWEEPFGLPALEASAMGIPAVVTRSGGLPEIVDHGVTGLVVNRNDPENLWMAISHLLSNPDETRRMGLAGARRARDQFEWTGYVENWRDIYHSLVTE